MSVAGHAIIGAIVGVLSPLTMIAWPLGVISQLPAFVMFRWTGQEIDLDYPLLGGPFVIPTILLFDILIYSGAAALFGAYRNWEYRLRFQGKYCLTCDYCLTGNESGICPECGTPIPDYKRPINQKSDDGL